MFVVLPKRRTVKKNRPSKWVAAGEFVYVLQCCRNTLDSYLSEFIFLFLEPNKKKTTIKTNRRIFDQKNQKINIRGTPFAPITANDFGVNSIETNCIWGCLLDEGWLTPIIIWVSLQFVDCSCMAYRYHQYLPPFYSRTWNFGGYLGTLAVHTMADHD